MTDARSAKEFRRFEPVASLENRSFFSFPEELAAQIIPEGKDTSSTALEALALEEYSTEQISEAEIRRLLGFETRMEEHAFLKEHGAFLHYSPEDVAKDRATALRVRTKRLQITRQVLPYIPQFGLFSRL
jgi:hypothetical protein